MGCTSPYLDSIIRSEVLKQFQFRIEHLYSRPEMIALLNDPVYQHYVMIDYQKEKQRADHTEKMIEKEKARAEQEKVRADEYRQKLIELGISV